MPVGTIESGIEVEIQSKDGEKSVRATTGPRGYFTVPNIPPNTYYVSGVTFKGTGPSQVKRAHITLPKKPFFIPVPGKRLDVGTYSIEISEKARISKKHLKPNP